jgi:NAD(P)-dependent dehydrogenase (short-subunit alcohol dehydrogenase family)
MTVILMSPIQEIKMDKLKDKVVVVTGGSAGLGRAIAVGFAKKHAKIAVLARGRQRLDDTVKEIKSLGGKATAICCDVSDAQAVEAAAESIEQHMGPIDIWVNNAMTAVFAPFKDTQPDEFKRVTEVTYLGFVYGTMSALKRMLPRDRGIVIQVGSALSERSIPLQSAYCGAKHAIRGFTDSIRAELVHDQSNVRITMVQMPAMNTPQFGWVKSRLKNKAQPVPPIFQPEVGAEAVVWASTRNRREVYVGLPTIEAMWGNKFIPGYLDRMLGKSGYQSQQTGEPEDPDRPFNLWQPVDGNQGAHGSFDDKSKNKSPALWVVEHIGFLRLWMIVVIVLISIVVGLLLAS